MKTNNLRKRERQNNLKEFILKANRTTAKGMIYEDKIFIGRPKTMQ